MRAEGFVLAARMLAAWPTSASTSSSSNPAATATAQ